MARKLKANVGDVNRSTSFVRYDYVTEALLCGRVHTVLLDKVSIPLELDNDVVAVTPIVPMEK